ncbi:hypothetical protein Mgra_00008266, partial [Meloidogyne graminicola]
KQFLDLPSSSLHNNNNPSLINQNNNNNIPLFNSKFNGIPQGFETILPNEILQKLKDLHKNTNIPLMKKQEEFDKIMNSVNPNILSKLPLPPGFELLPLNIQQKITEINGNSSINWNKKHLKIKEIIESLQQKQKNLNPNPLLQQQLTVQQQQNFEIIPEFFPPNPPPGFEKVLPLNIYQKLLQIHRNSNLSVKQKSFQIDQIMRSLPQNIIDNLPLPPNFEKLPPNYLKEVKKIFGNKSLTFQEKDQKIISFINSLPLELRKLIRPPLPKGFEKLNFETKEKIFNLFEDINLNDKQKQINFWKIINKLSNEEKNKINEEININNNF